jgi:hypothetical protein
MISLHGLCALLVERQVFTRIMPIGATGRPRAAIKNIAFILPLAIGLVACSNTPPQPEWLLNAHGGLQSFTVAYLQGNTPVAEVEFRRVRQEIAATGRPALLARAELARCAVRAASLEFDTCPTVQALQPDLAPAERAYQAYLAGEGARLSADETALLPEPQRGLLRSSDDSARLASLRQIEDPVSRLVAASVLLRQNLLPPAGVEAAVETASAQGWRRPLLAWLGVQLRLAQSAGRADEAGRIQRRISLVAGVGST